MKRHEPKKSWITNRIKRHIANRDKHYHLWLKTKSSVDYEKYRKKRNEVNMEIKNAKWNEVQCRIDHNNSRELFRYIKKVNGTLNQVAKCDLSADFNNYFITAADTSDTILTHRFKSQHVEQPQSIFMRPVTEDEVSKHISTLKNKKSVGMDCIEVAVLKKASRIVSPYLKTASNNCIHAGVFPQSMKIAKVIPIFKAGATSLASNYRPISILGNLSKLFEKVIHRRLMNYFEKFGILSENQYGFRKKKDSIQAATSLFKEIEANWRSKIKANSVFIDFREAFDAVDHSVLLNKLNRIGIRGLSHKLLISYLTNRCQYVKIEDKCSSMKLIKRGVPQGSILVPLLFLVYINDLGADEKWQSKIIKYADDTVIIEKLNTKSDDKTLFQNWTEMNRLDCNYTKTKFVVFEKKSVKCPNIFIGDHEVSSCESYKYLGIHFDKKLNFQERINHVIAKLAQQSGILYKLRATLNKKQLVQYIRSFISPLVQYGVLLYGLGPKTKLLKVFLLQKKLMRIALRLPTRTSVTEKFNELKIRTVFEYHNYEIFKFSLNQIRNGFKSLCIGTQNRQTRNGSLNIWNRAGENDRLDSRAIILINALRKWGVLFTLICEMDENCFQNYYHQIADLYIFENGDLIDRICN